MTASVAASAARTAPRPADAGPGMRPGVLFRLARAGTRTDTLRAVLTALSAALATLALLAACTVLAIGHPMLGGHEAKYTSTLLRDAGLRPGVALTLLLLTIPVLALAGQCARLGGPARDRRLAAVRLAGGTPRQALALAAAETGTASLVGSFAGLATFLVVRAVLDDPDRYGTRPLPTDVLPPVVVLALTVLAVPTVAALAAVLLLRGVVVTPLGVSRRVPPRRAPRPWPAVLLALGVAGAAGGTALAKAELVPALLLMLIVVVSVLLIALAVVLATAWLSYLAGRILHRYARGPAVMLAARRLMDDPYQGSRVYGALLTAALFSGGSAAYRALFTARYQAYLSVERDAAAAGGRPLPRQTDTFYLDAMNLVDAAVLVALVIAAAGVLVALAEAAAARRRSHAALVAAGAPRAVLGRSMVWQTMAPLVPAVALALTAGTLLGRSVKTEVAAPGRTVRAHGRLTSLPDAVRVAHVPWGELALYGAGALALVLAAVGVSVLVLRRSTSVEELRAA